jgi:hypothetical protein
MSQAPDLDDDEPDLSRKDRLRRVVLVCTFFMRNLAYYRGARESPVGWWDTPLRPEASFWRTMANNCLDLAVLEFCKPFADRKGRHGWRKVVSTDKLAEFEAGLYRHVGMTAKEWDSYLDQIRHYRDKFVAHLDDDRTMYPPLLDPAKSAVEYLHSHIVAIEAPIGSLTGLVADVARMSAAYEQEKALAAGIFARVKGS